MDGLVTLKPQQETTMTTMEKVSAVIGMALFVWGIVSAILGH